MTFPEDENPAASPASLLCAFIAGFGDDELPDDVVEQAKRCLLNMVGTAIAGARTTTTDRMVGLLKRFSGPGQVPVIGRSEMFDAPTAAFLNAASANMHDFDDTHRPTIIHPTAPVAPPLLAIADERPVSGAAFLRAFVLGVEACCRLGNAVSPQHYSKGWHITSTCGVIGAAVGVCKLLNLPAREMANALAIAACQASGSVEALGTDAKSVAVGNAARNGLLAALLAAEGLSGPVGALDGTFGFLSLFSDTPASSAALSEGLGKSWELSFNTFKPYPCGVVINPVIDACLEIRNVLQPRPEEISSIHIRGNSLLNERANRPYITTGRMSQVSAQHAAAVTLLHGKPNLESFSDHTVVAEDVRIIRMKTFLELDLQIPEGAAEVSVTSRDGRIICRTILAARGSIEAPLTRVDLEEKFVSLSSDVIDAPLQRTIIELIWKLEELRDIRSLTRLLGRRSSAASACF